MPNLLVEILGVRTPKANKEFKAWYQSTDTYKFPVSFEKFIVCPCVHMQRGVFELFFAEQYHLVITVNSLGYSIAYDEVDDDLFDDFRYEWNEDHKCFYLDFAFGKQIENEAYTQNKILQTEYWLIKCISECMAWIDSGIHKLSHK